MMPDETKLEEFAALCREYPAKGAMQLWRFVFRDNGDPGLMSLRQVAEYAGVTYTTAFNAAVAGRLRTMQPGGPNTAILTTREWVDEAMNRGLLPMRRKRGK